MRNKLIIVVLFFCNIIGFSQIRKTPKDVVFDGFRGGVSRVLTVQKAVNTQGVLVEIEKQEITYNNQGQKTCEKFFTEDKNLIYQTSYKRDGFNNVVLSLVVSPENEVLGRTFFSYNFKNILEEIIVFNAEKEIESRISITYNHKGEIVEKSYSNIENDLIYKEEYTYQTNGKIKTKLDLRADNTKIRHTSYEYDSRNNIQSETVFDYTNEEIEITIKIYEYAYDTLGNWTSKKVYLLEDLKPRLIEEFIREIVYF